MRSRLLFVLSASILAGAGCNSNGASPAPPAPATVTAIAACYYHTCAVLTSGAVRCWGANSQGELGDPAHPGDLSLVPLLVSSVASPAHLAAGNGHNCVRSASGAVQCWGRGDYGQLGNGAYQSSPSPVAVSGIAGAIHVAAGTAHGCAVVSGGAVRCWGHNGYGQLGDPDVATTAPANRSAVPVAVASISGATAVADGLHSCALLGDASVKCWGGQFNGSPPGSPYHDPVIITSLANVIAIAAGNLHNCAVVAGGRVKCWASNSHGQLGNGEAGIDHPTDAVFVTSIDTATAVTAGWRHSCALLAGGTVACWGVNDRGQLGLDPALATSAAVPVTVSGIAGATAVSAGFEHTCALVAGGQVKCWGDNLQGQLGLDPDVVFTSAVPVTIGF